MKNIEKLAYEINKLTDTFISAAYEMGRFIEALALEETEQALREKEHGQ